MWILVDNMRYNLYDRLLLSSSSSDLYTMVVGISHQDITSDHVDCYTARFRELSIAFAGVAKLTVI